MYRHIVILDQDAQRAARIAQALQESGGPVPEVVHWSAYASGARPVAADLFLAGVADRDQEAAVLLLMRQHPVVPFVALVPDDAEGERLEALGFDASLTPEDTCPRLLRQVLKLAGEKRRLRGMVRSTNSYYFHLFDENPNPLWIYDRQSMRFLLVNKAACREYGYTAAEFLQMSIRDIRPEEDWHRLDEVVKENQSETYYHTGNWRHIRKNGEVFHVRIFSQHIDYQGRPCRLVFVFDIEQNWRAARRNRELTQKLQTQKQQLDNVLASISDVVWSVRIEDWKMMYVSPACETVTGYTVEDMMTGRVIARQLLLPEDEPVFDHMYAELLEKGRSNVSYRIRAKDGTVRFLASHVSLVRDATGAPYLINGVDSDLTKAVMAETALSRQAEEVQTILDSITDGFLTLDEEWRFTFVNREFERVCRMRREDILGRNYWEVFPKAVDLKFFTEYSKAMHERISVHFEEFATSLNCWVSVNAYPTQNGLTIYFRDVSEEKLLHDRVQISEQNLKSLLNNTDDLIWSVDRDLKLISLNNAYRRSIYQSTGAFAQPGDPVIREDYSPAMMNRWLQYYKRGFAGEQFVVLETYEQGEESYFLEIRLNPILNGDGEVVGVSCFARNVTEEKRYQIAIEQQNERLREIAWVQSHKVRGPLASILGTLSVLGITDCDDAEYPVLLEGMKEAAEALDRVVREINDRTRQIFPGQL